VRPSASRTAAPAAGDRSCCCIPAPGSTGRCSSRELLGLTERGSADLPANGRSPAGDRSDWTISGYARAVMRAVRALGTTQSGALAALTSVRTSLVAGGIACVVGTVLLCALMPRFWRYDSVLEVAPVREDHADPGGIGRLHDLEIPLRSARLDDRRDAGVDGDLRAVREREEGV
jgi:hypothetical protein